MVVDASSFTGEIASVQETERGLEVHVRLRNVADRAIHYVAGPRAIDYDTSTSTLTIRLSDEGRVVVPGIANVHPTMSYLDPGAEAELVVSVPAQISKLAPSPDPERRKVVFERHRIADAAQVRVEIGWADTPFYPDQRPDRVDVMPSVLWEQHRLAATGDGPGAGSGGSSGQAPPGRPPTSRRRRPERPTGTR